MKPLDEQGEDAKRWTRVDLGREPPAPDLVDFIVIFGKMPFPRGGGVTWRSVRGDAPSKWTKRL